MCWGLVVAAAGCDTRQSGGPISDGADTWNEPGFWTQSSQLDLVLDQSKAPVGPHYEVVMCRSTRGFGVDMKCETIAHTFSTFDLFIHPDGLLLMGGLNMMDFGIFEPRGARLYALSTPDLETFGTHVWQVSRASSPLLTDAALERLPDGTLRAVYFSGPAHGPGTHAIKEATWDGQTWLESEENIYAAEHLLDPKTCSYGGKYHLFATSGSTLEHAVGSDPHTYQRVPSPSMEAQVPFCFENDEQLWLISQTGGGWGPPQVQVLQSDGTFPAAKPLWAKEDYPELNSCTSPVLGFFRETYVVFCAVHR